MGLSHNYNQDDVEVGDRVKLKLYEGYMIVTKIENESFDAIDGHCEHTSLQYEDIEDLRLESEGY